jgi:hypothetical protein
MTRDDIIRMAREAGIRDCTCNKTLGCLKRFAELVRAAEREACAQVCEEGGKDESGRIHVQAWGAAKAIRARGEK